MEGHPGRCSSSTFWRPVPIPLCHSNTRARNMQSSPKSSVSIWNIPLVYFLFLLKISNLYFARLWNLTLFQNTTSCCIHNHTKLCLTINWMAKSIDVSHASSYTSNVSLLIDTPFMSIHTPFSLLVTDTHTRISHVFDSAFW